jgi:ribonuclease-3
MTNNTLFEKTIGYDFKDCSLLEEALTHPSLSHNQKGINVVNYERLEFLGDAVLGMLVAEMLCALFPDEREGMLAKRHSWLVKGETLTKIGASIGIGEALQMTTGEAQTGGRTTASNLEDAMEALIGAIYLDGGLTPAKAFISRYWNSLATEGGEPPKDPKTDLQEWVQGQGFPLPQYQVVASDGPDHAPIFTIALTVKKHKTLQAQGSTRKKAEKKAAQLFMEQVKSESEPEL